MKRLAVLLLTSLLLVGCGGGDKSAKKKEPTATDESAAQTRPSEPAPAAGGAAPPPPASGAKARYIARVDSICRDVNAKLAPIRAKVATIDNGRKSKGAVFSQFHDLTGQAASISDAGLGQIQDVPPPPSDRAAIRRIRSLLALQVRLLHELADAAGRQDVVDIKRLNGRIAKTSTSYRAEAGRFGFKVCGRQTG